MSHREFEPASVIRGEKRVKGYRITCGGCTQTHTEPMNSMQHGGAAQELEYRKVAEKFIKAGWFVGRRPIEDRCQTCLERAKRAHQAERGRVAQANGHEHGDRGAKVMQAMQAAATAPVEVVTTMTREDRRVIFEKLNSIYLPDGKGYADAWTDAKVAHDLGTPRAWVAQVREEMFGPISGNELIERAVDDARALIAQGKGIAESVAVLRREAVALLARADVLSTQVKPIADKVERVERTVLELAKTLK